MKNTTWNEERRSFIGGSDARIIMGDNEKRLVRLWQEKRGEIEPEDLSGNLVVQLGVVTEDLNRQWFEMLPGNRLSMCSGGFVIQRCGGLEPLSMED
jgi:predicted phage-related endonuclease